LRHESVSLQPPIDVFYGTTYCVLVNACLMIVV